MSKIDKTKKKRRMGIDHDIRMPYQNCMDMTFREIKNSRQYALLTPMGIYNPSRAYHEGHKSTMRKKELCETLDDPKKYHERNKKLKEKGKAYGARDRKSRKGMCLVKARQLPCNGPIFKFEGLTTTGEKCCFKLPRKKGNEKNTMKTMKAKTKKNKKKKKK